MRRCLGCNVKIERGSRCSLCRGAYRVPAAWADAVKARDGYCCTVPGCTTPFDRLAADHIIPRAEGGAHTLTNGRTLCHRHHHAVHHGSLEGVGHS